MPAPGGLPPMTPDDAWAISDAPGARDLGQLEYWLMSQQRVNGRRARRRRQLAFVVPRGRLSAALVTMALAGPAAVAVSAHSTTTVAAAEQSSLSRGATGSQVRALQQTLGVLADGVFGVQTERALRRWQQSRALPASGVVDPRTRQALQLRAQRITSQATPADVLRSLQRALGVTVDGILGPQSRQALRRFEASRGLPADGVPDPAVLQALNVQNEKAATPDAGPDAPATTTQAASSIQRAVSAAMSKIGSPYRSGGSGPSAFDCSGLVVWAMRQAGVQLPRTSFAQYAAGTPVASRSIQAGDLVFFDTAGPGASDVGIAIGSDSAVSATTHGVMTHPIRSGYWGKHYVGARRVA